MFALLVVGSLVAGLSAAIREQDRLTFEMEVARTLDAMKERIAVTSNLLRGTAGLFDASEQVNAEEFRRYVGSLDLRQRYPGILGIGFTRRLDAGEVPALEASVRAAGRPDFRVWPETPRDEYHSIVYLEPLDRRNAAALGFDMFTQPVRRAAMTEARERGELVASGKVTLVQEIDPNKQAGFLMYLPIYSGLQAAGAGQLLGFVYSPLRVGDLLRGTRGQGRKLIDYRLYDGLRADPRALLRTTHRQARPAEARFVADHQLEVAGRVWLARFSSTPEFEALSLQWVVPWLALAALVASALLARLSWLQGRARLDAEAGAEAQRQSARTLHREREWLSATLASIGDAVIAIDADKRVTWLNPIAERLTGWARHDALGRHMDEVVDACPVDGEPMHEPLALGEPGRGEAMLRARDGAERPVDHNSAPIRDPSGAVSGAVIVLRDASERRRVEAELRANDRRKDEFLAMLAHELRNPLAPISAAASLLDTPSIDPRQLRDVSAILARQVRHMTELVDDLLEVSRVTRGLVTLDTEVFDLRDSIHDAVEQVRASLDSYRHVLDLRIDDAPLWVDGDRTRLTQVVANLLSNASKYTPEGGHITVRAGSAEHGVRISVEDTGVGMGPELLPHVFELFTQGERLLDRSQGGLGIGLALVRTIVDLHGGTVRAASPGRGAGSVFTVELPPADAAQRPRGTPASAADRDPGPLRIAIVDDNEDALRTIALLLELRGHRIRTFASAESALQSADHDPADVYILDIGLPGISGHELARRLRLHPRTAGAMLLALSGYGQTADVEASRAAGITEHLVKPVDPERLFTVLRRVGR